MFPTSNSFDDGKEKQSIGVRFPKEKVLTIKDNQYELDTVYLREAGVSYLVTNVSTGIPKLLKDSVILQLETEMRDINLVLQLGATISTKNDLYTLVVIMVDSEFKVSYQLDNNKVYSEIELIKLIKFKKDCELT